MTTKRITMGVIVSIVALALTVVGSIVGGGISYGSLKQKVSDVRVVVSEADTRSHANAESIARLHGKVDSIDDKLDIILDKLP